MAEQITPVQEIAEAPRIDDPVWIHAAIEQSISREQHALAKGTKEGAAVAKSEQGHREKLLSQYERYSGETLGQTRQGKRPAVEILSDHTTVEMNEAQLADLEEAVQTVDDLDEKQKKKWLNLIHRTQVLQRKAKSDIAHMWPYVGRDKANGKSLRLAQIHVEMLRAFGSDAPGVICQAPPKHGKSTTVEAWPLWIWKDTPEARIAIIRDSEKMALKIVDVLRSYIASACYRALYPHVRLLTRAKASERRTGQKTAPNNSHCFTLFRPNWSSTEASLEAVAAQGRINGAGFDKLLLDDPCPPDVAVQTSLRDLLKRKYFNEQVKRLRDPKIAQIRLVNTPWHKDDLSGVLVQQVESGKLPGWKVLIDQFRIKDDANGKPIPIWDRYDVEYLLAEQATTPPEDYDKLYRLLCSGERTKPVQQLHYYPERDDPSVNLMHPEHQEAHFARIRMIESSERVLSVDPSSTKNRDSTLTAVVEFAITPSNHAYVWDAHFMPGDPSEFKEWLIRRIAGDHLYETRRVIVAYKQRVGDDETVREEKRRASQMKVDAEGGISTVLTEWSGAGVGREQLNEEFVSTTLSEMNVRWPGNFEYVRVQGIGGSGGNQRSKETRLRAASPWLHNQFVLLPGRRLWNKNLDGRVGENGVRMKGNWEWICSPRKNIQTLAEQLINFNPNKADGADCVSQFISHFASRLHSDLMLAAPPLVAEGRYDPLHESLKARIASIRKNRERSEDREMEEEDAWMASMGI